MRENMLRQMLIAQGIRIQRWRLRDSIHRMDTFGVRARKTGRLQRRVYNVMGPNHLWHIDTNQKLVHWRFVVVGGIDGFSIMVMFLKCSDINRSGVANFGIPLRVRSDQGLEHVSVANFMFVEMGDKSMITRPRTHNQRIERLYRDIFEGVLSFF